MKLIKRLLKLLARRPFEDEHYRYLAMRDKLIFTFLMTYTGHDSAITHVLHFVSKHLS